MKLAMQVGRHYRLKEIQPRHFGALAKDCGFSEQAAIQVLKDRHRRRKAPWARQKGMGI
jgi:serine/threonine protein kinase HipA of HipAB toxin-antitoxin module